MKNFKLSYIIGIISIVVLGCICAFIIVNQAANSITNDVNKMVSRAKSFYDKGDIDNAVYQLQLYCSEKPDNSDGYMLLGDIYMNENDESKAIGYYKKSASNAEISENMISENKKSVKITESYSDVTLKIMPNAKYTKNMKLTFSGENLTPAVVKGKIKGVQEALIEDEDCYTTEWFSLSESESTLVMSGGINCSEWQFKLSDGSVSTYNDKNNIHLLENVRFANEATSVVEIPPEAVSARVTFYNASISETTSSDGNVLITYGKNICGYTDISSVTLDIPDLKENEYIEYANEKWLLYSGNNEPQELNFDKINLTKSSYISIDGDLCGLVEINGTPAEVSKGDKSKIYGVKYSTNSMITSCVRIGDAKGMCFDYTVDDEWAGSGVNDFDNAYPWCDMKLCNVQIKDGEKKITYSDSDSFKTDGSNGNVMVEIPKFYVNRTVKDGYEQICISGSKHDGYVLDPVFLDENGNELDKVYMSAYLGTEKDEKIISVSESYPTLMLSYENTLDYAENNGDGFSEMNYLMVSALQKLFVVETGVIDSSELFAGDSYMYYYYEAETPSKTGAASKDAEKSNTITVYKNSGTEKLTVGSSIAIFTNWDDYSNAKTPKREITEIKQLDGDDAYSKGYYEITFDGDPVNIKKNTTVISNIPSKTGKTNSINYCTGTLSGEDGKVSFKYRNIENIYGSALIMLDDDAYVQDGTFYYMLGYEERELDATVAVQADDLSDYSKANTDYCIKEMGYDKDNPTIMIPSVVGNGASAFSYYGDYWMYRNTDNDDGIEKYLLYGGADDNSRIGGIFQLRAIISDRSTKFSFYSARIMCR